MTQRARAAVKAFTFIELLIAVLIFLIIAVSVYSVFNTGLRVWRKTNPAIDGDQARRAFFNTLSLDLKNMIMYDQEGSNFKGESDQMSLMTLIELSDNETPLHSELAKVFYYFDKEAKSIKRLVATKAQGFDETNAESRGSLKLADDQEFGFEYCYKDPYAGVGSAYKWKDAWADASKVPRGIRIKVGDLRKTIFIPTGELGVEK